MSDNNTNKQRTKKPRHTSSRTDIGETQKGQERRGSSHRKVKDDDGDDQGGGKESCAHTREFGGFFVELGDGGGVEFFALCKLDEVGKVAQGDVFHCVSDVVEVDFGKELMQPLWEFVAVVGHDGGGEVVCRCDGVLWVWEFFCRLTVGKKSSPRKARLESARSD